MTPINHISSKQAGLTLLEILVALALTSVLMVGLLKALESNTRNAQLIKSYTEIQGTARFALQLLSRDLRMAGHKGCSKNKTTIVNNLDTGNADFDPAVHAFFPSLVVLDNYDSMDFMAVSNEIADLDPVLDSDIVTTSTAISTDIVVNAAPDMAAPNTMPVSGPADQLDILDPGMILMANDCTAADIFGLSGALRTGANNATLLHTTNVPNGPNNKSDKLDNPIYDAGSQILIMNSISYFIAPSSLIPSVNSLYRYSSLDGANPVELVLYIEDLQLTYSIDLNNDGAPDTYMDGDDLNIQEKNRQLAEGGLYDLASEVYGVHIELVISSESNVSALQLDAYPDDGHLRKRYSRFVHIKNAGYGYPYALGK